jgi:hypothetical protein
MERWSVAIVLAVLAGGAYGFHVKETTSSRAPHVAFHVRTAHCQIAGSTSPARFAAVCV